MQSLSWTIRKKSTFEFWKK